MCGRYSLGDTKSIQEWFDASVPDLYLVPRYNISPGQEIPIVVQNRPRTVKLLTWGFYPEWSIRAGMKKLQFNARDDTIAKSVHAGKVEYRRCLVPATGFFEWKREGKEASPFHFRLKEGVMFAFAGVYLESGGKDCCAIVTTTPNALSAPIHNRMPVILHKEEAIQWVDNGKPWEEVMPLMRPYPDDEMEVYPVTSNVGNARNDTHSLLEPRPEDIEKGSGPNPA